MGVCSTCRYGHITYTIGDSRTPHISDQATDSIRSPTCGNTPFNNTIFNFSFFHPPHEGTHRDRIVLTLSSVLSSRARSINFGNFQNKVLNGSTAKNSNKTNVLRINWGTIYFRFCNFRTLDIQALNGMSLTIQSPCKFHISSIYFFTFSCCNRDEKFSSKIYISGQFKFIRNQRPICSFARNPRQFFRRINFIVAVATLGGFLCQKIAPTRASRTVKSSKPLACQDQASD